jgi:isopentenyl diphosphate isomerase/L-lactate dehydrogenase-like FMN-dependent dehydrogenase
MEPLNIADYERLAEERVDAGVFGYIAGGAGDEHTLRANVDAFRRVALRPRMLVDVSVCSARATVLGHDLSMPLLVAPTAYQRLMHPGGEGATARAAGAAGTVFCQSTLSSLRPAELAAEAPDAMRWLQLYWSSDRAFVADLVAEGEDSGATALVFTVDVPFAGRRERDLRLAFTLPSDLPLPNLSPNLDRPKDSGAGLGPIHDESLTWRDLEWLTSRTRLPLVVKGILTAEDAVLACDHGAVGVVVSNHGGRQLDGVPASLDVLPEVVDAVGDRCEVLLDGGVRRGVDVLIAMALGARAVLTGRAPLYGLAVAGEAGATRVLTLLRDEIELGLALLGCPTPAHVTRAHVTA